MITGTERYAELFMAPPEMAKREVIFRNGAASASSALGRQFTRINDVWQEQHLPFAVPVLVTHPPRAEKADVRRWLNKNISGMWCFALPEPGTSAIMAVRFSDQTEASAFRIFWC